MSRTVFAFAVLVVVALAGWAHAADADDLAKRLRVMEERLAAVEKGTPLPSDGIVRVRGLVIQDAAGKERIVFSASDRGESTVRLRDFYGGERLTLSVGADHAGIVLLRDHQQAGVALRAASRGSSMSLASTGDHRQHLLLDVPSDGAVGVGAWGGPGIQNEQSHLGFWIWKDGTIAWGGGLRSAGRTGFGMKYDRTGKVDFNVRDSDESVIWEMPKVTVPPK